MAIRPKRIEEAVLAVLGNAVCEGSSLWLTGQLDRPLYVQTNEVLEAAGGKWNKKAKAHVFDGDAADAVESLVLTGQYTRAKDVRAEFGFFETPDALARRIVDDADIQEGHTVLEPSAGLGAIAKHVRFESGNTIIELDPDRAAFLKTAFPAWHVECGDFLAWKPGANMPQQFDRIVMNPPFAKRADIQHITKAFGLLAPGGQLVAIASASVVFRDDKIASDFRELVRSNFGFIQGLPDGSFKESGTSVNTVIVTMERAAATAHPTAMER